jgi:putative oxidoreductase
MHKFLYYSHLDAKGSLAMFLMRLVAGTAFIIHGWSKVQNPFAWLGPEAPIPGFFQALAAISEFGGGIAWIVGLLTPLASLGMFFTMSVAVFFHASKGDPFVGHGGSFEPALGYAAISFLILMVGPGRISLDRVLFGSKSKN